MARLQAVLAPARRRTRLRAAEIEADIATVEPNREAVAPSVRPKRVLRLSWRGLLFSPKTELLRMAVRRSRDGFTCECGGEAKRVKCTGGELARFGGERFARAFHCRDCRTRYVGRARPTEAWPN